MPLHDSYVKLANDVEVLLSANSSSLGLVDVFYGDQTRIPRTPAACVEPGGKNRTLNGMPRRTDITMTVFIILYHYQITGPEAIRRNNDNLAENVEDVLHLDAQMKVAGVAQVVDSMVTNIESGFQAKGNSLFRASRITFEARSQVQLPFSTP